MHSPYLCLAISATLAVALPSTKASRNVTSTTNSDCAFPPRYFTQRLDHFSQTNTTFKQKYYITSDYYKSGGPILVFQGEESTSLDCIESTILYNFAQELNGIAVALEHRYFGESKPFGPVVANYTFEQWKYLTLDNVMEDAVVFVNSIKENVPEAEDAPVFAASGSYGGFLVTMFRQNRPKTFDGVISSAPVLRAFYGVNDTNVPGEYNWWNYVSLTYRQNSAEAAAKIQQAFDVFSKRFAANDTSGLQGELGLCSPVNSTADFGQLDGYITEIFSASSEFNYNIARPGRSALANPLEKVIAIALETDDPIQILNRTIWLWYGANAASIEYNLTCLDWKSRFELKKLTAPTIEITPFEYIACSYLSFDASSTSSKTIFLPTGSPLLIHASTVKTCQGKYGISPPSAEEMYRRYRFTTEELQNSTGIIWSLGEFDPTTGLAGPFDFYLPLSGSPYASRRLFTTGMAHREDLFAQDEMTKDNVRSTNAMALQILKEWIELVQTKAK